MGECTQERPAKAAEASLRKDLAARHPNLTPEQSKHYERRIGELVEDFRQKQAQQRYQQQAQVPSAWAQEQGRAIER